MEGKEKNPTANLKKISGNIEMSRKNIQSDTNLIENVQQLKGTFGEIEGLIKGQVPAFQSMKSFSKEISAQSSKNLQLKRYFYGVLDRSGKELRGYLQVVKDNFVISLKSKDKQNWEKMEKELEKSLNSLREQSDNSEKIYAAISKLAVAKQLFIVQFCKLMLYRKNVLWRDLNAPYDDYIHGDIKNIINLIKSNEEKLGYTPRTIEFSLPKFDVDHHESNLAEVFRIILLDHDELVEGLKNYSKLNDQPQVIEDISKNQHIVKGLREKIEVLTKSYEALMEKYRSLQISKGKVAAGSNQEKSLMEKIEEHENSLIKKEQEIIQLKQNSIKTESLISSLKEKNKELEDELSKWHKYQLPKIKELEGNQKSILEEFNKVKRDLETYSNIVQNQREEKLRTVEDLKAERVRVHDLVGILGRERRKIKELKAEISRQQKIVLELLDKIPSK